MQGNKYIAQLFFAGVSNDISPELIDSKAGTVLEAHGFGISRILKNILRVIRGDKSFAIVTAPSSTISFIGGCWLNGQIVLFYRDSVALLTYVYSNGILIAQNADLPKQMFDCDTNEESSEIVITDNLTVPIVLNLNEMLAAKAANETTYFADYNFKLYSVNKALQLNQPMFVQLESLGAGGGLKTGSYSYAMCYSSKSGESTPWSPLTPYIPVPESAVSLMSNSVEPYAAGLKTWGAGEPSLTPGNYGIRLKLRVANLSGFDYIKLKRLANNTGQPISYTPTAEFLIIGTDASGSLIDIQTDPYSIIDFVDSDSRDWAILDDSAPQAYSTIKTARTARFYDRRIILGGIEYESKLISDEDKSDMFLTEPGVNRIALPIVKLLETGKTAGGFSNIFNQVYYKSHRLGERYGFGIKLNDEQGNTLYTVPVKHGEESKDDFTNYMFPNRRDAIPAGVKRVDTITLDGTIGAATILCNTVSGVALFRQSLAVTAQEFVATYAADYLAVDTTVVAYQDKLIFTSTIAGQDFTGATSITTAGAGDLTGTPTTTQANVPPIRQADKILFQDVVGTATIICTVGTVSVTRVAVSTGIAIDAATAFVADADVISGYAAIGVVASVTTEGSGGIILTGPAAGTAMTTVAVGGLIITAVPKATTTTGHVGGYRVDTIAFSTFAVSPYGPIGSADITCNGVTRTLIFDMGWTLTNQNFATNHAAAYLPDVTVTASLNTLIFTGTALGIDFTGATTVVLHTGGDLAGIVYPTQVTTPITPQKDEVLIEGVSGEVAITCEGLTGYVIFVSDIPTALEEFYNTYAANYLLLGVTVTYDSTSLYFSGPADGVTTITTTAVNDSGDLTPTVHTVDYPAYGLPQIDTVTLTGASGNARITCNAMTKGVTFTSSLTDTATKFCSDYATLYAAVGIDISSSGPDIIFTALDVDSPFFGSTAIINAADDMLSTVTLTPAVVAVAQVDTVTLLGNSGTATITCQGLTKSITFNIDLEITAHNFYDNYHAEYLSSKGVTVGFTPSGTITFTGPAAGTTIVTTVSGTLVDNVYTVYSPVAGVSQIDKVTITGSSSNITITCDGLTRGVSYQTSPTITAAKFVIDHYVAYRDLRDIEVTSVGADVFFRALVAGDAFATTSAQVVSDLDSLYPPPYTTRANSASVSEAAYSTGAYEDSTVESWNADAVDYVYDPVRAKKLSKQDNNKELNIVSVADPTGGLVKPYSPVTPVGRGSSPNQNIYDDIIQMNIMDTVEGVDNNVYQYGKYISTVGLRLGGIDTTKLPSNVKSFSVVRTPAAGRVVCQGIGMYALTEQAYGSTNPSLVKALNKLWFYSPEIDGVIGTKSQIYEDIKLNPSNYQIQLVAPCGFFSDMYSSYLDGADCLSQDMVSMPICGAGVDARPMFPPDVAETNYISFGKWRNVTLQGDGLVDSDLTFNISLAADVAHGKNTREPYLELTLSTNIYANAGVKNEASSTAQSKEFHEPWYIINIIQNKNVPNNNINSYNDIGHSIRLESIIGLSSGEAGQIFPLVEERPEDVYSLSDTATTYRYIWVDGLPWLDSNNLTDIATYLADLEDADEFTPTGGLKCYGIYTYDATTNAITFDQVLPTSLTPVVPVSGAQIVIKYNSNSPIEVFLGDTYVADATFLAVDIHAPAENFRLDAPMPHYDFTFKTTYHQARNPLAALHAGIWDDVGTHHISFLRQWLINFTCESAVNLPLAYKNFYPNRLYTMRPYSGFDAKLDTETIAEFFARLNIYAEYNDDYPEEYLNWLYGGLSTPASVNYDYEKLLPLKAYAEPQSGSNELLSLMKRFHWSTQSKPGYPSNKVFIPTNIYDLKNDKASQISILYDDFSERGTNLYVITDRGVGMLLTDKQMITTAEGNNLTILANDASLIKGEVWLNSSIGSPKEFWRGKSEGSVKLPNNIVANVLVFPSQDDIVMLSNNNLIQIADNNRSAIVGNSLSGLESIDLTGDFVTKLYSVIDQGENKLWLTIGTTTYAFNFDQNNWDGSVKSISFDKSFNAKYLTGVNDRNVLAHAINKTGQFGVSISHKSPIRFSTIGDVPYVVFSVTPELGRAVEFIDMFISASDVPYSIEMATNKDFTNSVTVLGTVLQEYKPGLYYMQKIPRFPDTKVAQAKTLFVKIRFAGTSLFYDLKYTKVGYKIIAGN